jgi:hypothetical protein
VNLSRSGQTRENIRDNKNSYYNSELYVDTIITKFYTERYILHSINWYPAS